MHDICLFEFKQYFKLCSSIISGLTIYAYLTIYLYYRQLKKDKLWNRNNDNNDELNEASNVELVIVTSHFTIETEEEIIEQQNTF